MNNLTIFTAPKPFLDPHINIIQRNAIQSWLHLGSDVEVLLVGEEEGMADVAVEFGIRQLPDVKRNAWGTPLVSSIFQLAREASNSPFLAYVNADILLLPEFVHATRKVASQADRFLIVGQRWDLDITWPMAFDPDWDAQLVDRVTAQGVLHAPAGSDYFVFPRDLFVGMPDFAIGRAGWDNWMIYWALKNGWHAVDATESLMVIHQNHDYSHLPGGRSHYDLEETRINAALGGGMANMFMTLDTNYELIDGKLCKARLTLPRLLRRLERAFQPKDETNRGLRFAVARRFRRIRRRLNHA